MNNENKVALNELVFERGVLNLIYIDSTPTPVLRVTGVLSDCDIVATDYQHPTAYVEEDYGELKFYFHPADFVIDKKEMLMVLNAIVGRGKCTGYDTERLSAGEITVFFNPTCHNRADRKTAIDEVATVLNRCWLH